MANRRNLGGLMSVVVTRDKTSTDAIGRLRAHNPSDDIRGGEARDWIVTGWFTPDYRPLAEKLAAGLATHGATHHLWARPKVSTGWNTHNKPAVVLATMDAYPGRAIVLMDVDCIVTGDLSPVADVAGDVGLAIKARPGRRSRIVLTLSSRVAVFRPTPAARTFAERWAAACASSCRSDDEWSMAWTFIRHPEIGYAHLDQRYIGRELGSANQIDGIVIWHDSAHDIERRRSSPIASIRHALKACETRLFRTGATRAALQQQR